MRRASWTSAASSTSVRCCSSPVSAARGERGEHVGAARAQQPPVGAQRAVGDRVEIRAHQREPQLEAARARRPDRPQQPGLAKLGEIAQIERRLRGLRRAHELADHVARRSATDEVDGLLEVQRRQLERGDVQPRRHVLGTGGEHEAVVLRARGLDRLPERPPPVLAPGQRPPQPVDEHHEPPFAQEPLPDAEAFVLPYQRGTDRTEEDRPRQLAEVQLAARLRGIDHDRDRTGLQQSAGQAHDRRRLARRDPAHDQLRPRLATAEILEDQLVEVAPRHAGVGRGKLRAHGGRVLRDQAVLPQDGPEDERQRDGEDRDREPRPHAARERPVHARCLDAQRVRGQQVDERERERRAEGRGRDPRRAQPPVHLARAPLRSFRRSVRIESQSSR